MVLCQSRGVYDLCMLRVGFFITTEPALPPHRMLPRVSVCVCLRPAGLSFGAWHGVAGCPHRRRTCHRRVDTTRGLPTWVLSMASELTVQKAPVLAAIATVAADGLPLYLFASLLSLAVTPSSPPPVVDLVIRLRERSRDPAPRGAGADM